MTVLRGALTALIAPFRDDGGAVDLGRLREKIHVQAAAGVAGVVAGTTGVAPALGQNDA